MVNSCQYRGESSDHCGANAPQVTTVVIIGGDNRGKGGAQLGQNCEGKESKESIEREPTIIIWQGNQLQLFEGGRYLHLKNTRGTFLGQYAWSKPYWHQKKFSSNNIFLSRRVSFFCQFISIASLVISVLPICSSSCPWETQRRASRPWKRCQGSERWSRRPG